MTDLVAFLRARFDEDRIEIEKHPDGEDDRRDGLSAERETNYPCYPYLRIGKARALAEVEAKRRIAELHSDLDVHECVPTGQVWPDLDVPGSPVPCPTLRLLAAVYADHPDYDPAWRPE